MLSAILICVLFAIVGSDAENVPHCPPVHHGSAPIYIPDKDCSKFWECSNGTPYLLECPDGLHFNPKKNECDWPELAGCLGNTQEEPAERNKENGGSKVKKICPKANVDCPAVDGEYPVYIPLSNCSQFCECSNGVAYLQNCPKGLHFNPKLNVCDWPDEAGCGTGGGSENSSESSEDDDESEGDKELCPEVNVECPAVNAEFPVYIPLSNCSQFCQCSNGVAYLQNCPGGLHFNPSLNVCDWPDHAGCGNGGGSESSSESNENSDESGGDKKLCPETNVDCPAVDGEFPVYIPLSNCSQFCQCSNGMAYLQNCPDGLHFNPRLNVCDWPDKAGCGTGGGGENSSESGEDDDESENDRELCPEANVECPAVDGQYPVYIPLSNCSQFCQCSNGIAYLHNCPDGLHFNPTLNVCDWPKHAGCKADDSSETTTEGNENGDDGGEDSESESKNRLCPETNIDCPPVDGEDSVYIPLPNCSQFCQCSNGVAYLHDCPDGLHFNPVLDVCDWPEFAGCATDGSSTSGLERNEDTDENWELCPEQNIGCPPVDGKYPVYAPLANCSQFCQCSNGIAYLHNCPAGLHFNPVLNVCDRPDHAGCQNTDSSSKATIGDKRIKREENDDDDGSSKELCPELIVDCPDVDGEYPVYFPQSNCSQFCECSNGVAYLKSCQNGLHFNPTLNVCDWPEDAGCANEEEVEKIKHGAALKRKERCPDVSAECPDKDGEYPVFIPLSNCSQFCICSNGVAYLKTCQDGLHFNPILNVCDWPENAGCISTDANRKGSGRTDKKDTSFENKERCPDASIDCPTVDGEYPVYIPLANKSQFCECSNGVAYLQNCPEGLHFYPDLNVCNWPEDAGRANKEDIEKIDKHGAALKKKERCPETASEECPDEDGEYPVFVPLPNCTQFCICSYGVAYLKTCPDGLHFNPVLNVCDWPENAGCTSTDANRKGSGRTDKKDADIEYKERCSDASIDCPTVDGEYPVYIPLANKSQFCECSNGVAYLQNCPEGLHFYPELNVCNWPENAGRADKEDIEKIDKHGAALKKKERCPETASEECPDEDGEYPVFVPLPNCTQFCICSHGVAYLKTCPDGLHFNPVLNVCDWPEDAGCISTDANRDSGRTDKKDASIEYKERCQDASIDCPIVDGEYPVYIPLANKSQFCECSNGVAYLQNCPEGLHFYPELNVCNWPENAGRANKEDVEKIDKHGVAMKKRERCPETASEECPDEDGEYPTFVPLPNCTQFCICSYGVAYLKTCPDGLHFNPTLNVCDWPENAGCISTDANRKGSGRTDKKDADIEYKERCPDASIDCPTVDGEYPVYIPLANKSQFCECSNGVAYLQNCPEGLQFNPDLNVCDWPEHAGGANKEEHGAALKKKERCPDASIDCPTVDGEYPVYIPLANKSQFCECSNGVAYLQNCPEGLHFNPDLNVCDWPEHAGGANKEEHGAALKKKKRCPEDASAECPDEDGEYPTFVPLPNCSQFCICSHGVAYLKICPDGLHFNPVLNVCDWPEDAGCISTDADRKDSGRTDKKDASIEYKERCPDASIDCPPVDGEHPVYIPLANKSQFCECSNGVAYLQNCPEGLQFNPDLNVCDWPEDAGCAKDETNIVEDKCGTGGNDDIDRCDETSKASRGEEACHPSDTDRDPIHHWRNEKIESSHDECESSPDY